jgi:cytoskeletal protein RodZ
MIAHIFPKWEPESTNLKNPEDFTVKSKVIVLLLLGLVTALSACQGNQETPTETTTPATEATPAETTAPVPDATPTGTTSPSPDTTPTGTTSPSPDATESPSPSPS